MERRDPDFGPAPLVKDTEKLAATSSADKQTGDDKVQRGSTGKPDNRNAVGCLTLIISAVALVSLLTYCAAGFDEPKARTERNCGERGKIAAMVASEMSVQRQLRAPKTAEFPSGSVGPGIEINALPGCQFKVRSYVDAENGFGANIRTRYRAGLTYNPTNDQWITNDLDLGLN